MEPEENLFIEKQNPEMNISEKNPSPEELTAKNPIENLTTLPGVGQKSAKALYEAGFKTIKSVISASEKDLLAVPGVGINLVKKLKK